MTKVSQNEDSRSMAKTATAATTAAVSIVVVGLLLTYGHVIVTLVKAWTTDDNYSHGFLIPPLAAYFAFERRRSFREAPAGSSLWGLVVVIGSLLLLIAGTLGSELFLTRISLIGAIAGSVLFL